MADRLTQLQDCYDQVRRPSHVLSYTETKTHQSWPPNSMLRFVIYLFTIIPPSSPPRLLPILNTITITATPTPMPIPTPTMSNPRPSKSNLIPPPTHQNNVPTLPPPSHLRSENWPKTYYSRRSRLNISSVCYRVWRTVRRSRRRGSQS